MGYMVDRKHRDFTEGIQEDGSFGDIDLLAKTFEDFQNGELEEKKGFSTIATIEDIAKQDYILTPGRYVGIEEQEDDGEPFEEKMTRLTSELSEMFENPMSSKMRLEENWGQLGMKYKLSEIMDIIGGGTPKTSKPEYWNGDIPWLSVKDINNDYRYVYETEKTITQAGLDNSSTKILKRNDSIISARGTVGEIAMIPFSMAFNQSCYGLRAKESLVDAEYLYYLIKHNVVILKKNTHGSVFDTITRDTFDGIEVELPSLQEQKVVASILRDLDDKIEVNNEINNNLEYQARAIFINEFLSLKTPPDGWKQASLIDIADYLNGLAMQNIVQQMTKSEFQFLKSKNFVKVVVIITVNCVLRT